MILLRFCLITLGSFAFAQTTHAGNPERDPCSRPAAGAEVPEPRNLYSEHGVLQVDLSIHNYREPDGSGRYCYLLPDGSESPTLRLSAGDLLILHLTNDLADTDVSTPRTVAASMAHSHTAHSDAARAADPCTSGAMTPVSTNLHFHGLTVPPVCHQDDVLRTSVQPSDAPFEYRFQIPANEPPGLYWYHPHIHGFSSQQVLGRGVRRLDHRGPRESHPGGSGAA